MRSKRSEVRGQRSEAGGRRPEVRGLLAADSGGDHWVGRIDFIRERVRPEGGLSVTPAWWTEEDGVLAGFLASVDCHGSCLECPAGGFCCDLFTCRYCRHWESADGGSGQCQDPAYEGERKRRTRGTRCCCQFYESRWLTHEELNRALRRRDAAPQTPLYPLPPPEVACDPEALVEFVEIVKRLVQRGVVVLPPAGKGES
jgi:hypothetical protein